MMHSPPDENESDCVTRHELLQQLRERFELHLQISPYTVKLYPTESEPEMKPRNKETSQLYQESSQYLADIKNAIEAKD